jgi:hypothetical protein
MVTKLDPMPVPGAFAVIDTGNDDISRMIKFGERLSSLAEHNPSRERWDHAVVCSRVDDATGEVWIVEAQPGGAVEVPWHYDTCVYKWSMGHVDTAPDAGTAARKYAQAGPWGPRGVPYSWLDYSAIAMHAFRIPAPGLRRYIASSMHQICSQLVDQSQLDAGNHLFSDGRWPGYVTPFDLGSLLNG